MNSKCLGLCTGHMYNTFDKYLSRKFTLPCKIVVPFNDLNKMNVMQTTITAVPSHISLSRWVKLIEARKMMIINLRISLYFDG